MRTGFVIFSAVALAAGAAAAQETLDEALQDVRVFDCALEGDQALYVFRTASDGAISLVSDPASPVRATEEGLTIMTADGLLEVSDGAYHIYSAGTAESGTCTDITEFAHTLYPAMTQAYTPQATGGTVAEQAAAASLADLTVRTERAEAEMTEALATFAELEAARDAAQAELAQTATERDTLQALTEEQSNALAAASAEIEDLTAQLAAASEESEGRATEIDALTAELAVLTEERDTLASQLSDTQALLEVMASKLEETEADLTELRALHEAVTAAATEFQGQLVEATAKLGETATKLDETSADNRNLVATVAGLNGKISELGDKLRATRAERDAALRKASDAGSSMASTSSLTNAAIARIATLQGRSQNAVRSELCRIIGRGSGC